MIAFIDDGLHCSALLSFIIYSTVPVAGISRCSQSLHARAGSTAVKYSTKKACRTIFFTLSRPGRRIGPAIQLSSHCSYMAAHAHVLMETFCTMHRLNM